MTTVLAAIIIIFFYTLLFCGIGLFLINKLHLSLTINSLRLGVSFFIGYTCFLFIWLCLGHLTNGAKESLFVSTVFFLALTVPTYLDKKNLPALTPIQISGIIAVFLTVFSLGFTKALLPMPAYFLNQPEIVNPFAGFGGVGHSFRAGNLTHFIADENRFPTINQHSGQSILASIPLFIANTSPQLSLVLWLNVFLSFLILLVYGFSKHFLNSSSLAIIPTLFILVGNTVLSPFYSGITDTESALLLSNNYDSLFGVAMFFILCFCLYELLNNKLHRLWWLALLVATIGTFTISASPMILIFSLVLVVTLLLNLYTRSSTSAIVKTLTVLFFATIIFVPIFGGMLAQHRWTETPPIPGLMQIRQEGYPALALRFPRTVEGGSHTYQKITMIFGSHSNPTQPIPLNGQADLQPSEDTSVLTKIKNNELFFAFAKIARSFQVVFFPITGILLFWYLHRTNLRDYPQNLKAFLFTVTVITFLSGWIISTFFTVYGYYWELSKFFYAGVFLSMLLLGLSLAKLWQQTKGRHRWLLATMVTFIITGPLMELVLVRMYGNFVLKADQIQPSTEAAPHDMRTLSTKERFNLLKNSQDIYGQD